MAVSQNKLLPILGALGLVIIGTIVWQQVSGRPESVKASTPMSAIPKPAKLPDAKGADRDNPGETLATVVASNLELRKDVNKIVEQNKRLADENQRLRGGRPEPIVIPLESPTPMGSVSSPSAPGALNKPATQGAPGVGSTVSGVLDSAGRAAESFMSTFETGSKKGTSGKSVSNAPAQAPTQVTTTTTDISAAPSAVPDQHGGAVSYKTVAPMGYVVADNKAASKSGAPQTQYVRTLSSATTSETPTPGATAGYAALAAKVQDEPYFTIPENATLVGVQAMTSIIGRVPIDGRVTDPMQFKALIGRDNLAANGWEMPDDLSGIIVTGTAIGDMALSCSEGKIRSLTFVFNDGTIRTVSSRGRAGGGGGGGGGDMGFISDVHGNPCIIGKFVTNAPRYLADIVGLKTLGVAGQAYAKAQQSITTGIDGHTNSTVVDTNKYVLGQAVSGATDEVTAWMLSRLKNSFDAVVTPSGETLVVHMDQEVRLDKIANARKIIHRSQARNTIQGEHYGLE